MRAPREWSDGGLTHWAEKGKRCGGGFRRGNGLSWKDGVQRHNFSRMAVYWYGMDPMITIPKDRPNSKPFRLVLLLGLTVLLFLLILNHYYSIADAMLLVRG